MNRKQRRAGQQEQAAAMLPPRQIIHPMAMAQLGEADEEGNRPLVVHTVGPNTIQVFPLDAEQVKAMGETALAAHVTVATPEEQAAVSNAGAVILP